MNMLDSPFARKLNSYATLSKTDLDVLSDLHRRRRRFASGRDMVRQGQPNRTVYVLANGWAFSYILLANGARQIVDFRIPGDFLGLRSILFRKSDQNVEPITAVEASEVLARDLMGTFSRTPDLAKAVLWAASRDESMLVDHLVGLGRRNAAERIGHFLLELGARLRLVGLASNAGYACPLTQYHLADALGLSAVHVNRVLRQLREDGLVTFQDGHVTFDDFAALITFAGFEGDYLDHDGPRRH